MKTKIERTIHSWHLSKRTLALVLSVVMLVSAIGAGSVLTAIAEEFAPSGAQVLANAAIKGAKNAPDATENLAEAADDEEENGFFQFLKEDLADTGADADIAGTGVDSFTVYFVPELAWPSTYSASDTIQIYTKPDSNGWNYTGTTMSVHDKTYHGGLKVYTGTAYYDGGFNNLEFSRDGNSANKVGYTGWTTEVDSYKGKLFDGTNWVTPTWDAPHSATFSVNTSSGGTISPTGSNTIYEDSTYATDVTATAKTGYKCTSFNVGTGINKTNDTASGNNRTAKVYAKSSGTYTVQAVFSKINYSLTKGTESHGTFTVTGTQESGTKAQMGDTVNVSCSPATGYTVSAVTYGPSGTGFNATKGADNNTWSFTMPAANTQVNVTFVLDKYAITTSVSPASSGSVAVTGNSGGTGKYKMGDTLTLTATPATHYAFSSFTVTYADSTTSTVTTNGGTISMSGKTGAVTIQANFVKTQYTGITYTGKYSTTGEANTYTNSFDDPLSFSNSTSGTNQDGITISAPNVTGYTFYQWVCTGGSVTNANLQSGATFKPSANSQTVTAQYKKNYTVTAVVGEHGSMTSGSASTTVAAGDTVTYEFTPASGYGLSSIKLNGVEKLDGVYTTAHSYTTDPITSNSTVTVAFGSAIVATATVSNTNAAKNPTSDNRIHYGTGTVAINGGTASSTTATANVITGTNVTFTATPDAGYGFGGWYTDVTCEHLVSSEATMTVPMLLATTYYAAFVEDNYYLVGKFYLADYAQYHQEGHTSTNFSFTQDPTDPSKFVYEDDFMFKYYTDNGSNIYHLQYVSVGWADTTYQYSTATADATSGTVASGASGDDDSYKWTIGTTSSPYDNCYKHVKITWDAINEKLSWDITDIDMSQYTVIYLKADNTWTWDHVYFTGVDSYIKIMGIPSESISGATYNKLIIKNTTLGTDEAKCKFHKSNGDSYATGDGNESGQFGGIYAGGEYKFDLGTSNWGPFNDDHYYLSGQYSNGTAGFFTTASATVYSDMKQMTEGTTGIFSWETPAAAATVDGCLPTGVIQFKVYKNADSDDAARKATYPDYAQSYRIKSNITKLTFSYNCATHEVTVTPTYKEMAWVSGDYYTNSGAVNSERKVADTPNIGSTSEYSFVWAKNDDGPGKDNGNCPPINTVKNSNNGYWADLTASIGSNNQFYFALANTQSNPSNSNIVGNKSEQINCSASNKAIYDSSGNKVFDTELKERSTVTNNAKYILINNMDWSKMTAIGVMAYYSGSGNLVDYQFYFKPTVPPEPDPVPDPDDAKRVDIYAKDGTLRDDTFNRFARLADTTIDQSYFDFTDPKTGTHYTSIAAYNADAANAERLITFETNHATAYGAATSPDRGAGYQVMKNAPVGAKIKIKTQLADSRITSLDFGAAFDTTHYLKAYSFNGMTYQLHTAADMTNGLVEEIWTVRDVNTYKDGEGDSKISLMKDGKTIEVTPIYYMQNNTNCKTFYIDGYDGTVQQAWGNMLSVYPYYENKSNKDNAFGGYPGQPMLLWGGKYQMEIPLTVDGSANGATVKGLTLHNGYWDLLHRDLDLIAKQQHAQTYDFDDFYKINKEKNPDSIIFDFKYFTTTDNYGDGYDYTRYDFADSTTASVTKNTPEVMTDYYDRVVNIFGTVLSGVEKSSVSSGSHLTVVSTGYKDTYVGEYATMWAVYKPDGSFLGYISPSMLYLNSISRVNQYTDGTNTADGRMSWDEFISTYNTLKASYSTTPVMISYEKEIWNDTKDKANRSDGKWYYAKNSDKIQANIQIQYGTAAMLDKADKSLTSDAWITDTFDTNKTGVGGYNNIGAVTGCSAYFTNTTPVNLNGMVDSGSVFADTSKYFTFNAKSSGSYIFGYWVRYSNGKYYEISDEELGTSNMSSNDTYIARFIEAKAGTLLVSHAVEQTSTYKGTGTPTITISVKNGGTDVTGSPYSVSDGSTIDLTKWIKTANRAYTIDISLSTDPDDATDSYMKEIVSSAGNYAATPATFNTAENAHDTSTVNATVSTFTVGDILDSGVTNLRYVSHLMKPVYTYDYEMTYTYKSRFYGDQSYTVTGTFDTEGKPSSAGNMTGAKDTAQLTTDFIINQTPYEKNFREKISWNYTDAAVGSAPAMVNDTAVLDLEKVNTYKMVAHVYSSYTVDDTVKAEFLLPYPYKTQENGYKADSVASYVKGTGGADDTEYKEDDYIFDESQESVTLTSSAYHLFTYDDTNNPDDMSLMEAAPYVWKNPEPRYKQTPDTRYFTGDSFKIGTTTYFCGSVPAGTVAPAGETYTALTEANTQSWVDKNGDTQTLTYAVDTTENGKRVVYSFMNYVKDGVYTGGYNYYYTKDELDGFYLNSDGSGTTYTNDKGVSVTGVKKYFTRWDIFNADGDYVASTYSKLFNYSGYDNYIIKPIYDSDTPVKSESNTGTLASITYLGDTRNQWNNGACGTYNGNADTKLKSDELYADFAIAYRYNGEEIQTIDSSAHTIKTGMIIERLNAVDPEITDNAHYAEIYKSDITEAYVTGIETAINNASDNYLSGAALKTALNNHTSINTKIGANIAGWGSQFGSSASSSTSAMQFDSVIDNMNRLQWCYNFKNNKTDQGELRNAKYVFRAWSYIIVDGVATVSDTPAYFNFYDTAIR